MAESRRPAKEATKRLKAERAALERQRRADDADVGRLAAACTENGELARLAEVQDRITATEHRLVEIGGELARISNDDILEAEVAAALAEFDAVWAALKCSEQVKILNLLIQRADHDGKSGNITITFHPTGLRTMATQVRQHEETAA